MCSSNSGSSAACCGMPVAMPSVPTPPGLGAIYTALRRLYPDQPNPLQVTALLKYWLGGPDPLDFISMYSNAGSPMEGIPPHWHYISSGLSDLHGDGRVHQYTGRKEGPSGFGFELTFRLKKQAGETYPPMWPAELMQALGKYVFQTENSLCSGDHISWRQPLDFTQSRRDQGYSKSGSHIEHMLMCNDPQLPHLSTVLGTVQFVQIVGVTAEELQATQHWNGLAVLELIQEIPHAGGPWLVTDMDREESIFEIKPSLEQVVKNGIEKEGSNLSGVSSKCWWEEYAPHRSPSELNNAESAVNQESLTKDVGTRFPVLPPIGLGSPTPTRGREILNDRQSSCSSVNSEIVRTRTLRGVHLRLTLEAAELLPLAIRGRLQHGRHFTFNSSASDTAITLVTAKIVGAIADRDHAFAACGPWLQVLITDEFCKRLDADLICLMRPQELDLPKEFKWPNYGLMITVVPND